MYTTTPYSVLRTEYIILYCSPLLSTVLSILSILPTSNLAQHNNKPHHVTTLHISHHTTSHQNKKQSPSITISAPHAPVSHLHIPRHRRLLLKLLSGPALRTVHSIKKNTFFPYNTAQPLFPSTIIDFTLYISHTVQYTYLSTSPLFT